MNTIETWRTKHLDNDLASGMRIGQSYICRVHPKMEDPKLWNERDTKRAWRMIIKIEKDYQL